ncbi:competence protein CoiA [Sutcliffiella horikoshii]|uniref:competence protein CoiA n=1 Tax=Sutcliffiella horikoshii TaxID=79883 RepID=UPI003CEFCF66
MFVAKRKDGSFISLLDWKTREDVEHLTKGEQFFCPACHRTLQLKHGQVRKVHFAHMNDSCNASSESETNYHLEGKAKLYESLLHSNDKTTLEHYIPSTNQRADVYTESGNQKYAFEFQCSTIPKSEFSKRTQLYESSRIKPIWILGKEKLGNIQPQMKFSPFQWQFLQRHTPRSPPYILTFCPKTSIFHYIYPTFSFNTSTTYISTATSKVWIENPNNMTTPTPSWKEHFLHYKKKWRYVYSLYKPQHLLRKFCYAKMNIPLSLFPAEIGLPVPSFYRIHTPVIEWQAWLYFDSIFHTPLHSIIHVPTVIQNFKRRIKNSQITIRELPLIKAGSYEDAIVEYLNALVSIGALKRETPIVYRKIKKELPFSSLEEGCKQDRIVLEYLMHFIQS